MSSSVPRLFIAFWRLRQSKCKKNIPVALIFFVYCTLFNIEINIGDQCSFFLQEPSIVFQEQKLKLRGGWIPPKVLMFFGHFVEQVKLYIPWNFHEGRTCFDGIIALTRYESLMTHWQWEHSENLQAHDSELIFSYFDRAWKAV